MASESLPAVSWDFSKIRVSLSSKAAGKDKREFGPICIHTDEGAAYSARTLDADAYTRGHDIFLGAHNYQPGTPAGQRLLAHELAHVFQQHNPGPTASTVALEREAEQAATDTLSGRHPRIKLAAAPDRNHLQPTTWKTGDVFVDATAGNQIKTQGGLFSGNDQAHVNVSMQGKLAYDSRYTTPEDSFRWTRLKEIVDAGHLKIFAVSDQQKFKVKETPSGPPVDRSIAEIRLIVNDLGVMGITLLAGQRSPDPAYDQIFYDNARGVGALAHELFGHDWLALKGAPSSHPPPGSAAERTSGTLLPSHGITDPFGNVFSGTVRDYIAKYIESLGSTAAVQTTAGQQVTVPRSPTQNVGVDSLTKAFSSLNSGVSSGLTKTTYSPSMAQAWRTICNNYDLMPTQTEAKAAGNTNLMYTKEALLALCLVLFQSWTQDQQSGFRILLADFNGNKAGFSTNELSTKLEPASAQHLLRLIKPAPHDLALALQSRKPPCSNCFTV